MSDTSLKQALAEGVRKLRARGARATSSRTTASTTPVRDRRYGEDPVPEGLRSLLQGREDRFAVLKVSGSTIELRPCVKHFIPHVPPHYYVKGGAAREALRFLLGDAQTYHRSRDVDLVRFAGTPDHRDHELSLQYMADDYAFGRGVEVVENRDTYFRTRDVTQNEVLYGGGVLEASFQALSDIACGVLRPTSFVTYAKGEVLSATVMKLLRFAAFAQVHSYPYSVCDIPESPRITDFDIALNLERAMQQGRAVAEEYLWMGWERGIIMPEREVPPPLQDAIGYYAARIRQGMSFFKHIPDDVLRHLCG